MKLKFLCFLSSLMISCFVYGQTYQDDLNEFRENYIESHEVVTGEQKKGFRFFPVNEKYNIRANFTPATQTEWVTMETSGTMKKRFKVYGKIQFSIKDTSVTMLVYQSEKLLQDTALAGYLFLPFLDETSAVTSYGSGRYIDLNISDIVNNQVTIDFNKAYNPYCAYVSGVYNCPVPPAVNHLPVSILAGEMNFEKE